MFPNRAKDMACIMELFPLPTIPTSAFTPGEKESSESRCDFQFLSLSFVIISPRNSSDSTVELEFKLKKGYLYLPYLAWGGLIADSL